MKEERHGIVIPCRIMSGLTVSPIAAYSPAQPPFPTPSPFSYSAVSSRWSSRPSIQTANLVLRFLALVLSFGSTLSMAALSPTSYKFKRHSTRFLDYPEFLYCFTVNILVFVYAAYQLFKDTSLCFSNGVSEELDEPKTNKNSGKLESNSSSD